MLDLLLLPEDHLELLWDIDNTARRNDTIYQCVRPLTEVGDILAPQTQRINSRLHLVPGDLSLAGFEDFLSQEWPNALGSGGLYRSFRVLSSFWQVGQLAAAQHSADIVLADVGPNLGAINRSALIGTDHVIIPLAAFGSVLTVLWSAARRRIGWIVVGAAIIGVGLSRVAEITGEKPAGGSQRPSRIGCRV